MDTRHVSPGDGLASKTVVSTSTRRQPTSVNWATLVPLWHILRAPRSDRGTRSKPLVLLPGAGGRRRRDKRGVCSYEGDQPACRQGAGPSRLGFYRRKEHLQGNKTKNKHPGHTRKRTALCRPQ